MKVVCAWHKKYFGFELTMGEKEPLGDKSATHGCCPECYKRVLEEDEANGTKAATS